MTDVEERDTDSTPVWVAKTIGYVILAAFVTTVAVNAFHSFFWETTNPRLSTAVSAAVGATIGVVRARRRRKAQTSDTTT